MRFSNNLSIDPNLVGVKNIKVILDIYLISLGKLSILYNHLL
jgi:hypothetical protein